MPGWGSPGRTDSRLEASGTPGLTPEGIETGEDRAYLRDLPNWPVAGRKKSFVLFLKTIVFNALIPNILLSRLSDEQKCIFSHLKPADFETVCDWSTSSWRNNLDTPWCNNLVCNDLDDVITLRCDVKIVTPQGHVLFTAFGKLMFEYIFWYEVNEWFLNDIAQKIWKIMGFQKMINSHDVQLVNWRLMCQTGQVWVGCVFNTEFHAVLFTYNIQKLKQTSC